MTLRRAIIVVIAPGLGRGCANMTSSEQRMLSGAAIGALGGAAVAAVAEGSVAAGAAIGAGVGAGAGYLYARSRKEQHAAAYHPTKQRQQTVRAAKPSKPEGPAPTSGGQLAAN